MNKFLLFQHFCYIKAFLANILASAVGIILHFDGCAYSGKKLISGRTHKQTEGLCRYNNFSFISQRVLAKIISSDHHSIKQLSRMAQKNLLRSLLMSFKKKDWRMWPHQSFFLVSHQLYNILDEGCR